MASLLFAAGILTFNKVKDKRNAKKEKKRKVYESRYSDLQREHSQNEEQYLQRQKTGDSQSAPSKNPFQDDRAVEKRERRNSEDSQRSRHSGDDDPSKWVDDVIKQRARSVDGQGGKTPP